MRKVKSESKSPRIHHAPPIRGGRIVLRCWKRLPQSSGEKNERTVPEKCVFFGKFCFFPTLDDSQLQRRTEIPNAPPPQPPTHTHVSSLTMLILFLLWNFNCFHTGWQGSSFPYHILSEKLPLALSDVYRKTRALVSASTHSPSTECPETLWWGVPKWKKVSAMVTLTICERSTRQKWRDPNSFFKATHYTVRGGQ